MIALLLITITAGPWLASCFPDHLDPHLLQRLLNDLCQQNRTAVGCQGSRGVPSSSAFCKTTEKKCPQHPTRCYESSFNCSILDLNIVCRVSSDLGISVQTLICGDGSRRGDICGTSKEKPVYSVVAAYCEGINDVDKTSGTSLGVVTRPGGKGGSGIYWCSEEGKWVPKYSSPSIDQLGLSCRNAGCGGIPLPSQKFQVRRRMPMVRAIKKNGAFHCSATIVSQSAALTAAHCLTKSESSEQADSPYKFTLEVPGPLKYSLIETQVELLHLHPDYKYNDGAPVYDLAVIFFKSQYKLPTLCMASTSSSRHGKELVFNLKESRSVFRNGEQDEEPHWDVHQSSKDPSCRSVSDRSVQCVDVLPVQKSQYCVRQQEVSIQPGSSGGPHLVEIGLGVKETWAIKGILSRFSNESSCQRGHLVYIELEAATTWLQNCVFNRQCT